MSTRKIKDAKDLTTNELIYFKGHAQATYMSDGRTVEEAVSGMSGGTGGSIDTSNLATKTELAQKQDIISDIDIIRSNAANYKGTVTGVKINGSTKSPTLGGTVDIGNIATSVKINGSTKSPTSGTVDIGNIATSVKIDNVSKSPSSGVVDLGYINKQLSTSASSSMTLSPNIYYRNTSTSLSSLTIKLGSVSNSNIINEYFVEFTTRSAGTTVTLPTGIKWANGETPTFEASTTYQISIVNYLGVVTKFK